MGDEYNYPPRMKWAEKIKELEIEIAKLEKEVINLNEIIEYLTGKDY